MTKAVHDEAPLDQRADVADNMAEEGSAVLVQVGEEADMTNVVEDPDTINVQVPGNDGGGAAEVHEGVVPVPVDDKGGADQTMSKYLLQPVEVMSQFILMREVSWPKLLMVEVMSVSKSQ